MNILNKIHFIAVKMIIQYNHFDFHNRMYNIYLKQFHRGLVTIQYNTIFISPYTQHLQMGRKNEEQKKLKKENKWRGNLKETTRLITSQASSLN